MLCDCFHHEVMSCLDFGSLFGMHCHAYLVVSTLNTTYTCRTTPFVLACVNLQVRDKVNHKYDSWHKELLGKFCSMVQGRVRALRDSMSSCRNQLEAITFDAVPPFEIATPITKVQQALAQLPQWQAEWAAFTEGEKLLHRQRFTLPVDWLLVSNLEGEWQSVNQVAMRRKDDMSTRMSALRAQVSAADAMLADSFHSLASDWERDR